MPNNKQQPSRAAAKARRYIIFNQGLIRAAAECQGDLPANRTNEAAGRSVSADRMPLGAVVKRLGVKYAAAPQLHREASQPPMAQICKTIKKQDMRKMKHILFLALAAFALASCTQDELAEQGTALPEGKYPLEFTARVSGNLQTRATVDDIWDSGNNIVLKINNGDTEYIYQYDGALWNALGNTYYWQNTLPLSVTAYSYGGKATGSFAVSDNQSTSDAYQSGDYLYAQKEFVFDNDNSLEFYHQTSQIVVHIRNRGFAQGQQNISLQIGYDNNLAISGNFTPPTSTNNYGTWDTSNGTKAVVTPYNIGTQNIMVDDNTAEISVASFSALVIPQTISAGQKLFCVMIEGYSPFYYTVPSGDISWQAGYRYTYNLSLTANGTITVDNAIGLPGGWTDEEEL